jgi:hypothetical protein
LDNFPKNLLLEGFFSSIAAEVSMLCKKTLLFFVLVVLAMSAVGCGSATPTPVAPTQAVAQITVIVTATPQPATDTPSAPTITPVPTIGVTETVQPVATVKPTSAPKPAATKKPVPPAATVTPSPLPLTLPAPLLVRPNFDLSTGQKDERHSPSDALVFEWQSISPLAQGVCYMIHVDFVPTNGQPGTGDAFLQCDPNETQKAQSVTVRFTLYQPGRTGVNYSGLLPNPSTDLWVKWYVTVVADQGAGTGPFEPISGVRHKVVPLSPKSNTFQFLLKNGG